MTDPADPEKLRELAHWNRGLTVAEYLRAAAVRIESQAAEIAELRKLRDSLTWDGKLPVGRAPAILDGKSTERDKVDARELVASLKSQLAAAEAESDRLRTRTKLARTLIEELRDELIAERKAEGWLTDTDEIQAATAWLNEDPTP